MKQAIEVHIIPCQHMSFDLAINITLQSKLTVIHTATNPLLGVLLKDFMIPYFVNHHNLKWHI